MQLETPGERFLNFVFSKDKAARLSNSGAAFGICPANVRYLVSKFDL